MAVPRGEEIQRLVTELTALGPITECQLANYFKNRKNKLAWQAKGTGEKEGEKR